MAALPVFLVHYDAPDWVRTAAASILASDIPVDLTVISNSGRVEVAGARVIETGVNLGYAGAANLGLRLWLAGNEPYCVVGSHDLHVERDTLRLLTEAAERSPSFGLLGPVTETNWAGDPLGDEAGVEVRTAMSGTCLLMRRACINEVGLFDQTFRSYGEDNELCARVRRHGWKVGRVPQARAAGRGTSDGEYRQINSMANRPLLALRTTGLRAALRAYLRILHRLAASLCRRIDVPPHVMLRVLGHGSARLMIGLVRQPPRS